MTRMNHVALGRAATLAVAIGLLLSVFLTGCDDFMLLDEFPDLDQNITGQLTIRPESADVQVRDTIILTASGGAGGYEFSVVEPNGGTLTWSTDTAIYTAPSEAGDYTVRVTDSGGATADATAHVLPAPPALAISPRTVSLFVGETQPFAASGGASDYEFSVVEPGGGTIVTDGDTAEYTAPSTAGDFTIRVTDGDSDTADALVVVTYPSLTLSPTYAEIIVGQTLEFIASGGAGDYAFSLSGGSVGDIDPVTGLFVAGSGQGDATVVVTDAAATTATASVVVSTIEPLRIVPDSVYVRVDGEYQFAASGGAGPYEFTLTVTDGTAGWITTGGIYTAPGSPATAQVMVTDADNNTALAVAEVVDSVLLGIDPLDPEIEEGSTTYFSWYGGIPDYFPTKVGPGIFTPSTGKYQAVSLTAVGVDIVTISVTDSDTPPTTVESKVTIRPATPQSLDADQPGGPGSMEIQLTWTDASSLETGYQIDRKQIGGEYITLATELENTEGYLDDSGLVADTNYVYRVTTLGETALGDPFNSNPAEFTIRVK